MVSNSEAWVGRMVTGTRGLKCRNGAGKRGLESRKDRLSEVYRKAMAGVPNGDRIARIGSVGREPKNEAWTAGMVSESELGTEGCLPESKDWNAGMVPESEAWSTGRVSKL